MGPERLKSVNIFGHAVNLEYHTCTCRAWQVTRKPCTHGLAFIAKLSKVVQMDDFVHECFSVDRLKKTYAFTFNPITSKDRWSLLTLTDVTTGIV